MVGENNCFKTMSKTLVYFVPGIKGSILLDSERLKPLWPPVKIIESWTSLFKNRQSFDSEILSLKVTTGLSETQKDPNIVVGGIVKSVDVGPLKGVFNKRVYDSIIKYIISICGQDCDFIQFAYDWRRSIEYCANVLMNSLRSNITADHGKIVLICHSYGGLVARYMVENENMRSTSPVIDYILNIGTPHYGSMKSVKYLSGGGSMSICSDAALLELCESFDCMYDTVPLNADCRMFRNRIKLNKSRARRQTLDMFKGSYKCKLMININIVSVLRVYESAEKICSGDGVVDVECVKYDSHRGLQEIEADLNRENEHINILNKKYIYTVIRYILDTPAEKYSHTEMINLNKT